MNPRPDVRTNPPSRRRPRDLPLATVTRLTPSEDNRAPLHVDGLTVVQGTLALDLPVEEAGFDRTGSDRTGSDRTGSDRIGVGADVELSADAEVRGWAARFAQAVVETVGGQRPPSQLIRWTSPDVFRDIERRAQVVRRAAEPTGRAVRPPLRSQVRSVHVCCPAPESAEVSVHVRHGHRSRALALRLERSRGRWLCTALEFG